MNKSRWILASLVTAAVGIIMVASFFFWPRVHITSAHSALTGQPVTIYFTAPVKAGVLPQDFAITNLTQQQHPAEITLAEDRMSMTVSSLAPGNYELKVPKNSFRGWNRSANSAVSFAVMEAVKPVASIDEIKNFFERAEQYDQYAATAESSIVMESSSEDKASAGGYDYSATNQQVEGVDESDIVKTDGDFIYDVTGQENLTITDIRNSQKLAVISKIDFKNEFFPNELYIDGELLVVIGGKPNHPQTEKEMPYMQELSAIRIYDVSDRAKPLLLRETGAEGYIIATRKIGPHVYMVTNNRPMYWLMDLPVTEDHLLPKVFDSENGKDIQPIGTDKISILPGTMEPSYSVITTLDIRSGETGDVETKAYLGSGEQLYMSKDHLYLTSTLYGNQPMQGNSEVFKFGLDGTDVHFLSAAQLKGSILNQFSMDEHDGYFRAVTTEGNLWDEKNIAKNHLFILDADLKQTGSVENLAKNERIYSARFMGDKAYMVTFRETDPLFVLDVADPQNPAVLGELKIPGFSNYLHPLDENHLIGFGYDTVAKKGQAGGEPIIQTQGMKISLFDVTDLANPKEQGSEIIGGQGTYSPVQHNHHALFLHPGRNLYGFPITVYHEDKDQLNLEKAGAMIYEITAENGITAKADLTEELPLDYMDWEREVQRLLYSENTVYTIAANEISGYSLDDFSLLDQIEK
ncbi:beta-propeller domain-containing protein [Sporosarcina cascadiensis]|uniref:beta-propeller domain-containing protein n=1 Tax=Sporosarcina cascadiensis TaxID=2660747 RepID=UPI0018917C98|nr:beta-propeller domain-containing protein [Sporosarcina cascadiensis]